jgi:hypothetical protein
LFCLVEQGFEIRERRTILRAVGGTLRSDDVPKRPEADPHSISDLDLERMTLPSGIPVENASRTEDGRCPWLSAKNRE